MNVSTIHHAFGANSGQSSPQTFYAYLFYAVFLVLHHSLAIFDAHNDPLQASNVDSKR